MRNSGRRDFLRRLPLLASFPTMLAASERAFGRQPQLNSLPLFDSHEHILAGPERVRAPEVSSRIEGDSCILAWRGDEQIEISFSRKGGVLWTPVEVRVDDRRVSFDGFYVAFNGEKDGFLNRSVQIEADRGSFRVNHLLEHPRLPSPIRVEVKVWVSPETKAVRFQVTTDGADNLHLDRLGLGKYHAAGLEPKRMYFGRMLVLEGPIEPFVVKYNYNTTRFWAFTMANGLTQMVGTDSAPLEFDFDPASGTFDLPTNCDSSITYTFVFTGKGAQEAISHFRSTLDLPPPPTLSQMPGRVVIMAAYPIRQRYEDFLDELAGRGMRDFIWLSYYPAPGERELVEPYGALYAVYQMYTDLFPEGPRKAENWSPEWVLFNRPGHMMRGYWNATRALPDQYVYLAKNLVQGTLGTKLPGRGFKPTPATRYSNLTAIKRDLRPTALYLDVHASKPPRHYYDVQGKHHPARDYLRHEKELFDFAREFLGNVPILSEGNGEAFAGIMDGGIFMDWPTPETLKISCKDWAYYPFIDQIHRGRLLPVGFHWPLTFPDPEQISLAILFGRQQSINAYYGSLQAEPGRRAQVYYLTSAFHKMLGLSSIERIDFADDNIHRSIVTYANGAKVWVNRGRTDWEIEGALLPPLGYLVTGPGEFRQYRARVGDQVVESLRSPEYLYFSAEKAFDFGPVVTDGALGFRNPSPGRIVFYELVKPSGEVRFRLGRLPGTASGDRAVRAWALLTRGRKLELAFPDMHQEAEVVGFRPAEMATTVGYEIELAKP